MRAWSAFFVGAVLAAAAFAASPRLRDWQDRDLGILVGEQVPPEPRALEAWLEQCTRAVGARRVTLLSDVGAVELSFDELGLSLDVPRSAALARQAARLPTLMLSTVRTTYPDGQRRFHSYMSTYDPLPEVYWVGAGTDLRALPPLPEGAQGVESGTDARSPPG